jgi:hypothetical protein
VVLRPQRQRSPTVRSMADDDIRVRRTPENYPLLKFRCYIYQYIYVCVFINIL